MKPIIFSTLMVQAILDGRKTQTRRVIKPQPVKDDTFKGPYWYEPTVVNKDGELGPGKPVFGISSTDGEWGIKSTYQPGDVLWVREKTYGTPNGTDNQDLCYATHCPCGFSDEEHAQVKGWRSPRFMPKEAARIFLLVTNVRVERVQEITPKDAWEEGCRIGNSFPWEKHIPELQQQCRDILFKSLWNKLNAKRGYGWDTNPWVWVVEFERMSKGEALLKESEVEEG